MKFVDLSPGRFSKLQERIDRVGGKMTVTIDHRQTSHAFGPAGLFIHSVNTALANGAPRMIATVGITDPVSLALKPTDSLGVLTDPVALSSNIEAMTSPEFVIQEALDMPMMTPASIQLVQSAAGTAPAGLVTLVAHHGPLPQATPRLGPYTEMINGGQVRRRLLQMNRPVLYLHGHIHEDVVEMVRGSGVAPQATSWPVIIIAAPLLSEGFNRIDVEFASDGRVLGLILQRIRVDARVGSIVRVAPERISIGARKTIDSRYRKFFIRVVSAHGVSGEDLVRIGAESDPVISPAEVEEVVSEAVWAGILETSSDDREPFSSREFLFR